MPTKRFALEQGGPERLEVSWEGSFKNLTPSLDGQVLGSFEDQKALKAGRSFTLEGGAVLRVQLGQWVFMPELHLTLDGEPIPGSAGDPAERLKTSYSVIFVVAALNVALGLIAEMLDIQFLKAIGANFWAILSGLVYGGLGLLVRQRQLWALIVTVVLYVLDGVAFLAASLKAGGTPPVGGILVRTFFALMMVRGFSALSALNAPARGRRHPRRLPPRVAPRVGASPAGPSAARPAPVRTLTGEAERRRLQATAVAPATSVAVGRAARTEIKTRSATDAAGSGLRFVARKCEITPQGLRVTSPRGAVREVAFGRIRSLLVRQLPPDPPWSSQLLLDATPEENGGSAEPIRIFGTTVVNYGALLGGSTTSRLENLRHLAAHLASQNPALSIDPETAAFIQGPKAPARFPSMAQFSEYDARFG